MNAREAGLLASGKDAANEKPSGHGNASQPFCRVFQAASDDDGSSVRDRYKGRGHRPSKSAASRRTEEQCDAGIFANQ